MSKNASHVMGARASSRPCFLKRNFIQFCSKKKRKKNGLICFWGNNKEKTACFICFFKKWTEKQSFFFALWFQTKGFSCLCKHVTPRGWSYLNKFGRGPLCDATYQISRLYIGFWFQTRSFLHISQYYIKHVIPRPRAGPFWPKSHNLSKIGIMA